MERTRRAINLALVIVCLGLGGSVMVWLLRTRPEAPRCDAFARVLEVVVSPVEPRLEETPVVAHGTVRPKNQVDIIPQASGKLIYAHKDLAPGKLIPKDELLFEIEPTVYECRVRQAEAETRRLQALLDRHDQELANLDLRVANVEKMVAIDENDYLTQKGLFEVDGVGTRRDVDQLHLNYLRQKDVLVELTSRRSLVPLLKLETQAQVDVARSRLVRARFDLENTKIFCPFRAKVERVDAYASEVVTAHFSIARLTDMEAFEISIGVDPRQLRWLDQAIHPIALEQNEQSTGPWVQVCWSLHGQEFTWRGRVTRFEQVDEVTRTARMVVEIRAEDMTATVNVGSADVRPMLSIGMYCRAELPVEPLVDALLVPRHAIYDNRWVYVFEPSAEVSDGRTGRLGRRQVPVLRSVGDSVLVDYHGREGTELCDLKSGEQLVVSSLAKPVVGMQVRLWDTMVATVDPPPSVVSPAQEQPEPACSPAVVLGQVGAVSGGG